MHHTAAMALDDYLTTAEACKLLGGLDRSTLSRWVQLGKIEPADKLPVGPHGAFLFRRSDVEALKAQLDAERAEASA